MSTTFRIEAATVDNSEYFTLTGNVDVSAEAQLKELPAIVRQPVVKIDFSRVGRINSMGIALLLRCLKSIREEKGASVYVRGLSQTNTILFKMTGIFLLATHEKVVERG